MKISLCRASIALLVGSSLLLSVHADTEYFDKPVAGSTYAPCSTIEFLLDRMGNDDDKVVLAQLYRHSNASTTTSAPAPAAGKQKRGDNDGVKPDSNGDDKDGKKDDSQDDNQDDAGKDKQGDSGDGDSQDQKDGDDAAGATLVQTLYTWRGADIKDNSDLQFIWRVPASFPAGDYHVEAAAKRIDELNKVGGDDGDRSDITRSRTFTITTGTESRCKSS